MFDSKYRLASEILAKEILKTPKGEQMKTLVTLCEETNITRGTYQTVYKLFRDREITDVSTKGRLGIVVEGKNLSELLKYAQVHHLSVGVTIPFSDHQLGMLGGVKEVWQEAFSTPVFFIHSETAVKRINQLLEKEVDIILIPRAAFEIAVKNGAPFELVMGLGTAEYKHMHEENKDGLLYPSLLKESETMKERYGEESIENNLDWYEPVIVVHKDNAFIKQALLEVTEIDKINAIRDRILTSKTKDFSL